MLILAASLVHLLIYWGLVRCYDEASKGDYHCVRDSLRNQFLCTLPLGALVLYMVTEQRSATYRISWLPIFVVAADVHFYLVHRAMHSRWLWPYHKRHHRGTLSIAKSLDADLPEHLIANFGSYVAGYLLMYAMTPWKPSALLVLSWSAIATWATCTSHCAQRIHGDQGLHTVHHHHLNANYGVGFYLMDRLLGTYKPWRDTSM